MPTTPFSSVNDMTIAAKYLRTIERFKADLSCHFEISDLGEIHWLLRVEVTRDRRDRTISLSQHAYIESILKEFRMADCKPIITPMDLGAIFTHDQC